MCCSEKTTQDAARKMDRNVLSVRPSQRLASLHPTLPSICLLSIVRVPHTSGKRLLPSSPLLSSLYAIVNVRCVDCWVSNHHSPSRCPISCLCADTAFSLRSFHVPFRRSVRRCTIPVRSDHQDCQTLWSGWMHSCNTPSYCFFCRLVPVCWSGNKSHRFRSYVLIRSQPTATSCADFNRPIVQICLSRSESSDCLSVRSLCTRGITTSHLDPHLLHRSGRNDEQNINRVRILRIGL